MAVEEGGAGVAPSPEDYCRTIEAYLCRKNDGHLIRIVGPSFERVCGWAEQGVPVKVALRGIDRYFERYYAKGPRRRPVRVDFCEADVLDAFDEWRRAVGVSTDAPDAGSRERHESLPAHLERAIARLTALRAGADDGLAAAIDAVIRELDAARAGAKGLRGADRASFLARLAELDAHLLSAARARLTSAAQDELRREAETELAPFRGRMPPDAFARALASCIDRLLRERQRLPVLRHE